MIRGRMSTAARHEAGVATAGIRAISLRMRRDERGHVTELFVADWLETAGFVPLPTAARSSQGAPT